MKRSQINREIQDAIETCKKMAFYLPDYAYWTLEEWEHSGTEMMKKSMLGWDITDYGANDFNRIGAVLFTLRNGSVYDSTIGTPFCEKIIIMKSGQKLPMHFHFSKTEDIVNRNGAVLHIRVFASKKTKTGYELDLEKPVTLCSDGVSKTVPAGTVLDVSRGNSVTIAPYIFHEFFADEKGGALLVGEVSTINDDTVDNYFYPQIKLSPIEEDEPVIYRLCSGYVQ